jgi:RNA polymerase sigma-70 factor (ECF subfamily)
MDSLSLNLRFCGHAEAKAEGLPEDHTSELSQLDSQSDEKLIELFRTGSSQAVGVLFDRYKRLVLSIALKILRDHAEAEDIVQDVFLEVCKRAELFDPRRGRARIWILQYAYSRSLNRRKYLALRHFDGHSSNNNGNHNHHEIESDQSSSILDRLTLEERGRMICRALGSLSTKQREVFRLTCSEGLLLKEIADRMGETPDNIRHYYYRGLKKLREELSALFGKDGK